MFVRKHAEKYYVSTNFMGKQLDNYKVRNAKFSGYCFYMKPNIN